MPRFSDRDIEDRLSEISRASGVAPVLEQDGKEEDPPEAPTSKNSVWIVDLTDLPKVREALATVKRIENTSVLSLCLIHAKMLLVALASVGADLSMWAAGGPHGVGETAGRGRYTKATPTVTAQKEVRSQYGTDYCVSTDRPIPQCQ